MNNKEGFVKQLLIVIALAFSVSAQSIEYGTIDDIKPLKKVFVVADDEDTRATIIKMVSAYEGLELVNNSEDAEILLEFTTLTRDVDQLRGTIVASRAMALKSQMRAIKKKPDGGSLIAWAETETYERSGGFALSFPNEVNLTHHFVRDLQKARGEKPYSARKLYKGRPKPKKN